MYIQPDKPQKIECKGIQLVRRDVSGIVKEVSKNALDHIMYEKAPDKALEAVKHGLRRLYMGQVPIKDLVFSKSLRADYKNLLQAHLVVARKIQQRNPGAEPKPGDRVPFVYVVDVTAPGKSISCRAEDPEYAEQNDLPIDYQYYANALCRAVSDIVGALGHDITEVSQGCGEGEYMIERKRCERQMKNQVAKQPEITSFFRAA